MGRFNNGWVKIYKEMADGDIGKRGNFTLGLLVRLLCMANWRDGSEPLAGQRVTLLPGQLATGLRELSPDVEEDPYLHRVRTALNYLVKRGTITQATSNHGRIITICNWDEYQVQLLDAATEGAASEQAWRKQGASGAQHIEDLKNIRKNTRRSRAEYEPAFEEAYNLYPRKEGKSAGYRIYQKLTLEEKTQVKTAIQNYAKAKSGTEARFYKMFGTFMGEWTDWLSSSAGSVKATQGPKFLTPEQVEELGGACA
jgi:hypothetical protein